MKTPIKRQVYSQQILPQHISYLQSEETSGLPAILADNDSNSAIYTTGPPACPQAREEPRLQLHAVPPHSPDIIPMYACFHLLNESLKQARGDQLNSMDYRQLRHAIESAWRGTELKEIRGCISDLPRRCEKLAGGDDGSRVKGSSW